MSMKKILFIALALVALASCKEDEAPLADGTVNLNFTNLVANSALVLNSGVYNNAAGESFTVNELKYIISNIVLLGDDNTKYTVPQADSYFVINQEDAPSLSVSLDGITGGSYNRIRFGFGVDQSNYPLNGVNNFIPTAEENDMLWSWSAGYKFIKFEGTFSTDTESDLPFLIHVGSHGSNLDNYKEITLNLGQAIDVNDNSSTIAIAFDVAQIFDAGTVPFSLEQVSDIQVDPVNAPILATNVSNSFSAQ